MISRFSAEFPLQLVDILIQTHVIKSIVAIFGEVSGYERHCLQAEKVF